VCMYVSIHACVHYVYVLCMSRVCQNCGNFRVSAFFVACSLNGLLWSQGVFVPRDESFTSENNQISEVCKSGCGSISGTPTTRKKMKSTKS
jgi:hypothetical protein